MVCKINISRYSDDINVDKTKVTPNWHVLKTTSLTGNKCGQPRYDQHLYKLPYSETRNKIRQEDYWCLLELQRLIKDTINTRQRLNIQVHSLNMHNEIRAYNILFGSLILHQLNLDKVEAL